jgi:ADP-heptose:LPS heptosyltransferase
VTDPFGDGSKSDFKSPTSEAILIWAEQFGLGDLWQVRCVLHDLKRAHPTRKLVFAANPNYHDLLRCHPDLDQLVDLNTEPDHFAYTYNLDRACAMSALHGTNTVDYFATSLGIEVTDYNPRFKLSEEEEDFGLGLTQGRPTVGIAPVSSTRARDLTPECRQKLAQALLRDGWQVVLFHDERLRDLPREVIQPQLNLRQLIAAHHAIDALISVDTSHLHIGAGIGKPTVLISATMCGHIYSRHYRKVKVIQRHPIFTKCKAPDITGVTAEEIMTEFRKLEIN